MAAAILGLDAVLNLAGAGTTAFFAAITAFAIAGGCYVGHRVVSEGDQRPENHQRRRAHKASM
jgi:hypothetical protein